MALRPLKTFFPAADDIVDCDLPTLGRTLLVHLKSYEGLNTVYQHADLNRKYFQAMLENHNVGLGQLPKETLPHHPSERLDFPGAALSPQSRVRV